MQFLPYEHYIKNIPQEGNHIIAHQLGDSLVVYQAYKKSIADFAVKHKKLGGSDFSFSRMSWIKPGFLWMMFRSGWATKANQESILALWVKKSYFDTILEKAVHSVFQTELYSNLEDWKAALQESEVRVQWDPDHDPFGNRIVRRRVIQLGLKGNTLREFAETEIQHVEDITFFVKEQFRNLNTEGRQKLLVPLEGSYLPEDYSLARKLGLS